MVLAMNGDVISDVINVIITYTCRAKIKQMIGNTIQFSCQKICFLIFMIEN